MWFGPMHINCSFCFLSGIIISNIGISSQARECNISKVSILGAHWVAVHYWLQNLTLAVLFLHPYSACTASGHLHHHPWIWGSRMNKPPIHRFSRGALSWFSQWRYIFFKLGGLRCWPGKQARAPVHLASRDPWPCPGPRWDLNCLGTCRASTSRVLCWHLRKKHTENFNPQKSEYIEAHSHLSLRGRAISNNKEDIIS